MEMYWLTCLVRGCVTCCGLSYECGMCVVHCIYSDFCGSYSVYIQFEEMAVINNSAVAFRNVAYNMFFKRTSTTLMFVLGTIFLCLCMFLFMCISMSYTLMLACTHVEKISYFQPVCKYTICSIHIHLRTWISQAALSRASMPFTSSSTKCGKHLTRG